MNLVSLSTFNAKRFPDDPRSPSELQRWCREKYLPARKIGGEWFVDLDAFDAQQQPIEKSNVSPIVQLAIDSLRKAG